MKRFLNAAIDWLQAKFPPNRVVVLLGGITTAVSGAASAWLAAHFPGISLGAPEIAGIMTAALLISIRLLDRWFDRWQEGERVDFQGDLETALDEFTDTPDVHAAISAIGTFHGIRQVLEALRLDVENDQADKPHIVAQLGALGDSIEQFLQEHPIEEPINAQAPADATAPHHPV